MSSGGIGTGFGVGITAGGSTYVIQAWGSSNVPVSGGDLARVVKPFTKAELLLQRLIALRPKEGEETAAEVTWGGPSDFTVSDSSERDDGDSVEVDWPKDDEDLEQFGVEIPTLRFEEFSREVDVVRVENPDDPDQYVMVERITKITFKGPDLRPIDAAAGLGGAEAQTTVTDPLTGAQFTADGRPTQFRLPYIYYEFTLNNEGTND